MITFELTEPWEFYPGFILQKAVGMFKTTKDEKGDSTKNIQLSSYVELNGFDGLDTLQVDLYVVDAPTWNSYEIWFHNKFNLKQMIR